ncbi:hypothetical protein N7G274_003919 [Stereocaulon virgatum]|uniref:UDP-N-acetylglucosamine 1-carboxyvinyltransferase n=1 Tax=Stereocaulon virgatum TaxID=373712 RepID=A0ABR4ACP3_9LECA
MNNKHFGLKNLNMSPIYDRTGRPLAGKSTLQGVPRIADVYVLLDIMSSMNVHSRRENDDLRIDTAYVCPQPVPIDLAQKMRASILLLGPFLARFGKVQIPLPGGCSIGARPIGQHAMGLRSLGAHVTFESSRIVATARVGSMHSIFNLELPNVTGTESFMLAASRSERLTAIRNAARQPEIEDLAAVLQKMEIKVEGAGTSVIRIHGTSRPNPYSHRVMPDCIECGTVLIAGALLGNLLAAVRAT